MATRRDLFEIEAFVWVEIEDEAARQPLTGSGGDGSQERSRRSEVPVRGAAPRRVELGALEHPPRDRHAPEARVVDLDPAIERVAERDLAPVDERHHGAVLPARDRPNRVESLGEVLVPRAPLELVGADRTRPVPRDEAGERGRKHQVSRQRQVGG